MAGLVALILAYILSRADVIDLSPKFQDLILPLAGLLAGALLLGIGYAFGAVVLAGQAARRRVMRQGAGLDYEALRSRYLARINRIGGAVLLLILATAVISGFQSPTGRPIWDSLWDSVQDVFTYLAPGG